MPPRHAYWTIILEGKPTAFRAHTRDELVPTFKQLQARHPDAVLMWFARGRLWPSQEHEREDTAAKRQAEKVRRGASGGPAVRIGIRGIDSRSLATRSGADSRPTCGAIAWTASRLVRAVRHDPTDRSATADRRGRTSRP